MPRPALVHSQRPCLHVQVHWSAAQLDALLLNHRLCSTGWIGCTIGQGRRARRRWQQAAATAKAPEGRTLLQAGGAAMHLRSFRSHCCKALGIRGATTSRQTPLLGGPFTNPALPSTGSAWALKLRRAGSTPLPEPKAARQARRPAAAERSAILAVQTGNEESNAQTQVPASANWNPCCRRRCHVGRHRGAPRGTLCYHWLLGQGGALSGRPAGKNTICS